MRKGFMTGLSLFVLFVVIYAGATNFDRIVLGSGNYGTDPNSTADITLQNDEYISNNTDGLIDFGNAQLSNDSSATFERINFGTSDNIAGTDSLAITLAPAIEELIAGSLVMFVPDTANTGAFVVNVNSLGWKAVKTVSGADPANSDIVTSGLAILAFDGTDFHLINPATTTD